MSIDLYNNAHIGTLFAYKYFPDAIIITETWIQDSRKWEGSP